MRYILENEYLICEFDTHDAELKSVESKKTAHEYMWYGDEKYWGRTSPVLFPFVGSLKNKEYVWQGKKYPMGQHGFARDMEFAVTELTLDEIWFGLKSDAVTISKYPFEFALEIGYRLSENELFVKWRVRNTGNGEMYFSIGAHPAFICPVHGESSKTGYKIGFDGAEKMIHHGNTRDTGLSVSESIEMPLDNGKVTITDTFFDRCTYFFENRQTGGVTLYDTLDKPIIKVTFDAPLFALWSPEGKNAPFICIEPWYGRCDSTDFEGDLAQREYTNILGKGETFAASYKMTFFEV